MAEHEAASLSPADVQTAANLCSDGDILVLPAGTYNGFNTQVNVSLGVSIRGAGKTTTVINKTSTSESKLIHYPTGPVPTATMEISGFTVRGAHDGSTIDDGLMIDWCTSGSGVYHVNIHDMVFSGCGDAGLYIQGLAEGVIYNCDFLDNYAVGAGLCYGIALTGIYAGETGGYYGTHSWTTWPANTNPGWGEEHFVFIEDCTFDGNRHSVDGGWGARYVCRNNTFGGTPADIYSAHINSHGRVPFDSGNRGTRAVEVYNNAIVIDHYEDGITSQSGDGLIWSNVLTGAISSGHGIMIENAGCTHDAGDYPASDQSRNTYIWGNTENGTDSDSDVYPAADPGVGNFCTEWLVKNRDFYLSAYSYTPYTYPHPLRGYAPPADPEINIQYNSINIPDGNTYNFGSKTLNSNTDQIFTLGNIGAGDLTLSGTPIIVITGDNADQFSVQAQPTTPIVGFSNTTFTLRFTPTSLGAKVAAISIVNDDADENPYNITLNGIGSSGQYYVDQADGNDSWDGLAPVYVSGTNGPWKTIAQVNGSSFLAGDTVLFQCGEIWREQLTVPDSGSDGSPITFGAYGTGAKPKIYGSTEVATWADEGSNIWYATCAADPLTIWFVNTGGSINWGHFKATKEEVVAEYDWWWDDPNDRLYIYAATDPDARYTSVEKPTRNYPISSSAQSYITVQDIELAYGRYGGISVGASCIIQRLTIHHIGAVGETTLDNGVYIPNKSSSTVAYCDISECGRHGIYVSATSAGTTSNNIIEHNTVHNCYHTLIDVMNIDGTASGNITRYNLLYTDSDYADPSVGSTGIYYSGDTDAGHPQVNGEIYYNILFNIYSSGIHVGNYTTGTVVYNNLCYGTNPLNTTIAACGIGVGGTGTTTITVKNNIVMDVYNGLTGNCCFVVHDKTQLLACDNNLWYQSGGGTRPYARLVETSYHYDDFAAWQSAMSSFEANSLWEDPLMTDPDNSDFTLQATSPCINAGVDVSLTEDYAGNPIVGLPDIGAYEYPGGAITAVTIFFGCNF